MPEDRKRTGQRKRMPQCMYHTQQHPFEFEEETILCLTAHASVLFCNSLCDSLCLSNFSSQVSSLRFSQLGSHFSLSSQIYALCGSNCLFRYCDLRYCVI